MSFREKALVSTEKLANPSEVQSEPHLPSDVVLGQLVTERIGLEKGIVLSFSSLPKWGSGTVRSRLVLGANTLSPTDVGALSEWLTQITVSAFLSTSLDLHCYWFSASINVSFFTHFTFMSPLVFLLTPLAPRIVSFDYPPTVEHTISS